MAQSAVPLGNAIRLGPRTRRVIRSAARLVNPLVLRIVGRRHMPVVGIVHHRGRKTGRADATPLGICPAAAGGFVDERRGVIAGATFTGTKVAEWLHAATIAIVAKTPVELLWQAVPAFPTRSEIWLKLLEHREAARGSAIIVASRDQQPAKGKKTVGGPAREQIVIPAARTRPAGRVRDAASGRPR